MLTDWLNIAGCLLASAFFSGIETALLSLGPLNIVRGNQARLYNLYQKRSPLIATVLVGNNLTIVGGAIALHNLLGDSNSAAERVASFGVEIVIFFVFAEVIPKTVFRKIDLQVLSTSYYLLLFFHYMFRPITYMFSLMTRALFRIMPDDQSIEKKDIFYFIDSEFVVESKITEGMLKLSSTMAKEVMTPLADLYMLEKNATVKDAIGLLGETNYTRYPIYENRGDRIVGYVDVDDFLRVKTVTKLEVIMKSALFIPETLPADQTLFELQKERQPMGFVVSEFGSVLGQVTLEDIAEELVGDILTSEQVQETPEILPNEDGDFLIDGNMDIDDFNDQFSVHIRKVGFETLAGYLIREMGRIPANEDALEAEFGHFVVKEVDKQAVRSVLFTPRR